MLEVEAVIDSPNAAASSGEPRSRAAAWILLIQGIGLIATVVISWWFLRHVDVDVAAAVHQHPAFADQADHVRSEVRASEENRLLYALTVAPLLLAVGGWLLRRSNAGSRAGAGVLCLVSVFGCIAAGCLNFMSLSGNEPLLNLVPFPRPWGEVADLIASNWLLTPLTVIVAAAFVFASSPRLREI